MKWESEFKLYIFPFDMSEDVEVDKIISKLIENGGKDVKLLQSEIRGLCVKARQIFLEQPMML